MDIVRRGYVPQDAVEFGPKYRERMERAAMELRPDVDRSLYGREAVVTTDAIILNHCLSWFNMACWIIEDYVPDAWIYRLETPALGL